MLQRKVDRAMEWLKEQNQMKSQQSKEINGDNEELEHYDPRAEWLAEEGNKLNFEKGDLSSLILSAILVFGPIFLILIAILVLVIIW